MKTRNIAFTLGLLASTAAFAEGSSSSGASSAPSGTTSGSGSAQSAPADGTVTGAMGGTANNADTSSGGALTNGSNSTGSSFGNPNNSSELNSGTAAGGNEAVTRMNSGALNSRQSIMDTQRSLVNQGFSVSVDGRNGPQTTSAIRQFQARNGLPETGVIDTRTQEALSSSSSSAQPSASDTSAE